MPSWCPVKYEDPGIETVFMPPWMEKLTDQELTIGGANLLYNMGEPLNVYKKPMNVSISGGAADLFIRLDTYSNIFMVLQNKLVPEFAGIYQIKVTATYQGPKNLIKLTAYFHLTVKASQNQNPIIIPPEVKKEVIIVEKWPGLVYEGRFKQPALPKKDEPIPYIRDFNSTGVMLIGWTN